MDVPTSLNSLNAKVDDLDVGKLKTVPVDLKKVSDVVKLMKLLRIQNLTQKTKVASKIKFLMQLH